MAGRVIPLHGGAVDDQADDALDRPSVERAAGELEDAVSTLLDLAVDGGAVTPFTAVRGALTLKLARLVDRIDTAGDMTVAQTHTCREFRMAFAELSDAIHRSAGR